MSFKYLVRCAIQPGFHEDEKLKNLVEFCKASKADDVMFFINCEDLNQGHLTMEETKPWMDLISRAKPVLAGIGVTTSINPWTSLLHCDRGRTLRPNQKFFLMVDRNGMKATAQACPLCRGWRKYIAEMYSYYASVKPFTLWVEDDFRLHNHAPLSDPQCFCELHMREFSRLAGGKKLTRESFFPKVLRKGKPHPYRKIWLDVNRRAMADAAKIIGSAVHRVSPATMVGLMSSHPAVQAGEGRDWKAVLSGLAGKTRMLSRPSLPAYEERTPGDYLWHFAGVSTYTIASIPTGTIVYPELDNHSLSCTRFTKSQQFSDFQIILSLALGATGITMNIFDMLGNGPNLSEKYQFRLAGRKKFLDEACSLGLSLQKQEGVKVLFSPLSSRYIRTRRGSSIDEIWPHETFWSQLLSCYGITVKFTDNYRLKKEIVAVSGQYFRSIGRKDVEDLFKNNKVILDGEAAETLFELGMGDLAGIKNIKWMAQDSGAHSYEEAVGKKYFGLSDPRTSAQVSAGDYLKIGYAPGARVITAVKSPEGKYAGPGITLCNNCVVFPYFVAFNCKPLSHLTPVRQKTFQEILKEIAPANSKLAFSTGCPYLPVYRYGFRDKTVIMIVNCSMDDIKNFSIFAANLPKAGKNKTSVLCSRTGRTEKAAFFRKDSVYHFNIPIESMEAKILIF